MKILFQRVVKKVGLKKGALYYLAGNFVQAFCALITLPIISNYLSAEDFGTLGLISSYTALLTPVLHFSSFNYFSKKYSEYKNGEISTDISDRILGTIVISIIVINLFVLLIIILSCLIYKRTFDSFIVALLFSIVFTFLSSIFTFELLKHRLNQDPFSYFKLNVVYNLLTQALIIIFVTLFSDKILARFIAPVVVVLVFFIWFNGSRLFKYLTDFDFRFFVEMIKFSYPLIFSSILVYFTKDFDKVILSRKSPAKEFGLYNLGQIQANYFFTITTSLFMFYEPKLYLLKTSVSKQLKVIGEAAISYFFILVIFILMAKPIAYFLTNGNYSSSYLFSIPLAISIYFSALTKLGITIFSVINKTWLVLAINIIGCIITLVSFYFLIDAYQSTGAAYAKVLATVLTFLIFGGLLYYVTSHREL